MHVRAQQLSHQHNNQPSTEQPEQPHDLLALECGVREKWSPWNPSRPALICHVSPAEVSILSSFRLLPRTPLEIELSDLRLRLLPAWVAHCYPAPAGGWISRCRLYRDLTETELALLRKASPRPQEQVGPDAERRVWVRCCCTGVCHVHDDEALGDVFEMARVRDLSRGGIGLVLSSRVERGAILDLEFPAAGCNRVLLAWVAHVTAQADGTWLVGCSFASPLDDSAIHILLRTLTAPTKPMDQHGGCSSGEAYQWQ